MTNEYNCGSKVRITIVGAGGIGSSLLDLVAPALSNGVLAGSLGGIRIRLMDGDVVEHRNIAHQRFDSDDIGLAKVVVLAERYNEVSTGKVTYIAEDENLVSTKQLSGEDIVIIAVDRPEPRRLVHALSEAVWLDLRCRGDAMLALDHSSDTADIERMTPNHEPASCQLTGAIESGNIEFGFGLAAIHGAQWCLQTLRSLAGVNTRCPPARALSVTHGILQTFIRDAPESSPVAAKIPPSRSSSKWSRDEEERLLKEAECGWQLERVVAHHERSEGAIFRRLCRLVFNKKSRGDIR